MQPRPGTLLQPRHTAAPPASCLRAWGSRVQASGAFSLEQSRGVWKHGLGRSLSETTATSSSATLRPLCTISQLSILAAHERGRPGPGGAATSPAFPEAPQPWSSEVWGRGRHSA